MRSRCRCPCLLTVTVTVLYISLQLFYQLWLEWIESYSPSVRLSFNKTLPLEDVKNVVLVWWTPFTGDQGSLLTCGAVHCFITEDRRFRQHPLFQTFLFYGSTLEAWDLPLPQYENEHWALLHEESPKNVPLLSHSAGLSIFHHAATFSRKSDVPLTLQYLRSIDDLTDRKYLVPLERKNKFLSRLAPVLYVQSDCDTPLDRDVYVKHLMNFIPIDSYGACLQNKRLPESMIDPAKSMESEEFLHFVARYKFTIAFENAVCEDYITEKLWRTLTVGSVPIYLGSPSVRDWLPNNNSAILASEFSSPKALAKYILHLNENDGDYTAMLAHKDATISNELLLSTMYSRPWGPPDQYEYHFVNHFECEMCRRAHRKFKKGISKSQVTEKDYFCPKPLSSLTGKEDPSNPWLNHWEYGKCEAAVLRDIIDTGVRNMNKSDFLEKVVHRARRGTC